MTAQDRAYGWRARLGRLPGNLLARLGIMTAFVLTAYGALFGVTVLADFLALSHAARTAIFLLVLVPVFLGLTGWLLFRDVRRSLQDAHRNPGTSV